MKTGKEFCFTDNQRGTDENKEDAIITYQICKDQKDKKSPG